MGYAFLFIAFCANGAANVLLKAGAESVQAGVPLLPQLLTNGRLIFGVGIFALNVVFYLLALRLLPLSTAYPVMVGMTFLIVSTGSIVFLHESITLLQYVGYGLIVVGLMLVTFKLT